MPALAELARRKPYVVRFIEFMPLDADERWDARRRADRRRDPRADRGALAARGDPAKASSTARRFRFADGEGEIGFVNPVSEPFCSTCDRIRLTADGQLRTCLFSRREWDLKTPLRAGRERRGARRRSSAGPSRHKELKHRINDPGFVRASALDVARSGARTPVPRRRGPDLESLHDAVAASRRRAPSCSPAGGSTSSASSRSGSGSCSPTRSRAASPTGTVARRSRTRAASSTSSARRTRLWSSSRLQSWARSRRHSLARRCNWTYWLSQFAVVGLALLWIYFRRHEPFIRVPQPADAREPDRARRLRAASDRAAADVPRVRLRRHARAVGPLNHGSSFVELAVEPVRGDAEPALPPTR